MRNMSGNIIFLEETINLEMIKMSLNSISYSINDMLNDDVIVDISHESLSKYIGYLIQLAKKYIPILPTKIEQCKYFNRAKYNDIVIKANQISSFAEYLLNVIKNKRLIFVQKYRDVIINKIIT